MQTCLFGNSWASPALPYKMKQNIAKGRCPGPTREEAPAQQVNVRNQGESVGLAGQGLLHYSSSDITLESTPPPLPPFRREGVHKAP